MTIAGRENIIRDGFLKAANSAAFKRTNPLPNRIDLAIHAKTGQTPHAKARYGNSSDSSVMAQNIGAAQ